MTNGWPVMPLGEVLTERQEIPSVGALAKGDIRIVAKIGFNDGKIHLRNGSETKTGMILVRPGDILISGINAAKGAIAIYGEENTEPIAATIHYGAYIPNKGRVDVKYLWWLLRGGTFRVLLYRYVPGGIKTELKAKRLLPIPVPLPPLEEQRRIVAKMDRLVAQIEGVYGLHVKSNQAVHFLYDLAVQSICYAVKYPLSTFGEVLLEAKNGIYKPPGFWGRGIPCIRMYNIDGPSMNTINLQLLDVTADELSAYSCEPGDLVFNRVNSSELVGKTGIITEKYPKCTFESKNMRLRVNQGKVMPEFVAIILNSKKTKEYYRRVLKQQCGMATLNQGHVRNIPFPTPPLPEQQRIVAHLHSLKVQVEELDNLKAEMAVEIEALIPSILDKAFKGEL